MEATGISRQDAINVTIAISAWLSLRVSGFTLGIDQPQMSDGLLMFAVVIGYVYIALDVIWFQPKRDGLSHKESVKTILENTVELGIRGGYVYLIRGPKGYYKIGHTKDPKDRYQTFKLNLPFEIEYLHLFTTYDRYAGERTMHECFSHRRVKGTEWFKLSGDDIKVFKGIKHL